MNFKFLSSINSPLDIQQNLMWNHSHRAVAGGPVAPFTLFSSRGISTKPTSLTGHNLSISVLHEPSTQAKLLHTSFLNHTFPNHTVPQPGLPSSFYLSPPPAFPARPRLIHFPLWGLINPVLYDMVTLPPHLRSEHSSTVTKEQIIPYP